MADCRIKQELSELYIRDSRLTVQTVLGRGSYGTVKKIIVDETECAAKLVHKALLDPPESQLVIQFIREVKLLAHLRHPNIIQFLGICELPEIYFPALVTELMHSNLHDFLLRPDLKDAISLSYKKSMLEDVARGLIYLHRMGIIHRDLTARNVLLTSSLVAKIADLGNSRLLPKEEFAKLSSNPGTQVYMPPEAGTPGNYSSKLDIFSFGHLSLFTLIQIFPDKLLSATFTDGSTDNTLKPRSEVDRRGFYFHKLEEILPNGAQHPLSKLTKQCLSHTVDDRPEAVKLLSVLNGVHVEPDGKYADLNHLEVVTILKQQNEIKEKEMVHVYTTTLEEVIDRLDDVVQQKDEDVICQKIDTLKDSVRQRINDLSKTYGNNSEDQVATTEVDEDKHKMVPQQCKQPPFSMSTYPQAIVLDGHIYMGGGYAPSENAATVLDFDVKTMEWKTLENCPTKYFGLAVVKKQLFVIGGINISSHTTSGRVYFWDEKSSSWILFKCTSMLMYRSTPSVVSYDDKWLIAIGGEDKGRKIVNSVEKINVEEPKNSCRWYNCAKVPISCAHFSSVIIDDNIFVFTTTTSGLGSSVGMPSNKVFCTSVETLLSSQAACSSVWHEIVNLPLKASTALSFNGSLLALGGLEKPGSVSSSIYQLEYNEASNQSSPEPMWTKVGDLPCGLYQCAAVQYENAIFVHGLNIQNSEPCVYFHLL